MNGITAFVDASNVYGSTDETASELRNVVSSFDFLIKPVLSIVKQHFLMGQSFLL